MGLLDAFMPGETGGMPNSNNFLNFLQTPQGQALASGIASYAAGARRGTPINNIGRGLLGGVSGYGDAIKSRQEAERQAQTLAYNKKQQELLGIHYDTERMRSEAARRASEQKRAETEGFNKFMLPGFQKAVGYQIPVQGFDEEGNPVFGDSEGQIIPAAFEQQGGFLSTLDPDMREMIGAQIADPAMRKQASAQLFKLYVDGKRTQKEARDVLAKEKAMAEAMGIPVGEYLKTKMNKSGVNVNVQNVMPGEAAQAAGKKEGFEIGEQAAMIENKYSAIDSVREAKDMLKQGIYTGYWADVGKTLAKASMGAVGDRQKAARTEQFMSYIGNTVVPRLKEFGGNDSNEEMRYLQKIMGGDITMEPEAISAILESAERKISRGIERLQRQRGALEKGKMPDLGPGPARGQTKPTKPADLKAAPSVDDLLKKYGGK